MFERVKMRPIRAAVWALVASMALVANLKAASATQLWIADLEPQWREVRGWPPNDFMALFDRGAPWQKAAAAVSAMTLSLRFVLTAPEQQLNAVLAGLREHGIKLAMQAQPLTATRSCGLGIESFGPPNEMQRAAERLTSLHAALSYIVLDEPLYFGHQFVGQPGKIACRFPIATLAESAARKMEPILKAYPNAILDDVEPFGGGSGADWARDILTWQHAFQAKAGERIRFIDADVIWQSRGGLEQFLTALPVLRQGGLSIGVIYHGFADAQSDTAWCDDALREVQTLEIRRGIDPDRASIESWNDRPRALLPDSRPGSLTNLVLQYMHQRQARGLALQRAPSG